MTSTRYALKHAATSSCIKHIPFFPPPSPAHCGRTTATWRLVNDYGRTRMNQGMPRLTRRAEIDIQLPGTSAGLTNATLQSNELCPTSPAFFRILCLPGSGSPHTNTAFNAQGDIAAT
jgi:hypothetical protein